MPLLLLSFILAWVLLLSWSLDYIGCYNMHCAGTISIDAVVIGGGFFESATMQQQEQ